MSLRDPGRPTDEHHNAFYWSADDTLRLSYGKESAVSTKIINENLSCSSEKGGGLRNTASSPFNSSQNQEYVNVDSVLPDLLQSRTPLMGGKRGLLESAKSYLILSYSAEITAPLDDDMPKCSNLQTFMNLIKGSTGTGILTLPFAFMHSGLWTGLFGFLLISLVAVHCMHIMVRSAAALEIRSDHMLDTYPAVVAQCFANGPRRFQRVAPIAKVLSQLTIYVMQCSFCCVFIVWMAVNVKSVVDQLWPGSPDVRMYEVAIFLLLLPYVMVRDLRVLALFSALANVLYVISLVVICQYLFQDLPDASERPAFKSWGNLPLFLGTSVYCFECVCLVIPLRSRMFKHADMSGWTGLLTLTETIVVAVDTAIGFYGYLKFGEQTAPAVTLNLPGDQWLYRSVTLMFAVCVFVSLAVQFYVPVSALWPLVNEHLTRRWPQGYNRTLWEGIMRAALLAIILIVAVAVPHIELLVALIGSFFGCIVSMIVPAIVDLVTAQGQGELTVLMVAKDAVIICVGMVGLVSGTYTSVVDIVSTLHEL